MIVWFVQMHIYIYINTFKGVDLYPWLGGGGGGVIGAIFLLAMDQSNQSGSPESGLFNFDLHHVTLPLPTYLLPADDGVIMKLGRPEKK